MVGFGFYDSKTRDTISTDDVRGGLPDDVVVVVGGPLLVESNGYTMLTRILNDTSKKSIARISISRFSEESPEYLAFLVFLFNKTSCISLWNCLHGNSAFSCLMASLFSVDGILALEIDERMSTEQSKLFFAGVGASPCLQKLRFRCDVIPESRQEVTNHLIQALRRNQSLQILNVQSEDFDHVSFLRDLLKEVVQKKRIREFHNGTDESNDHVAVDALQDALCHKDCELETLHLQGVIPLSDSTVQVGCVIQNSSVQNLALSDTGHMTISTAMNAVKLFKSLVKLDLSANGILDLSELDDILLQGETNPSSLQSLNLYDNEINGPSMEAFAQKLPRMKSLRNLDLSRNPFLDSSECCNVLKEALWENTRLERLCPVLGKNNSPKWSEYVTALNRAGRGPLKCLAANPSSVASLWPLILYRANNIKYYAGSDEWEDEWEEPTCTVLRADAVFWILRETMTSVLI